MKAGETIHSQILYLPGYCPPGEEGALVAKLPSSLSTSACVWRWYREAHKGEGMLQGHKQVDGRAGSCPLPDAAVLGLQRKS